MESNWTPPQWEPDSASDSCRGCAKAEKVCVTCYNDSPWDVKAPVVQTTTTTTAVVPERARAVAGGGEKQSLAKRARVMEANALADLRSADSALAQVRTHLQRVQDEAQSMMTACSYAKQDEDRVRQEISLLQQRELQLEQQLLKEGENSQEAQRTLERIRAMEAKLQAVLNQLLKKLNALDALLACKLKQVALQTKLQDASRQVEDTSMAAQNAQFYCKQMGEQLVVAKTEYHNMLEVVETCRAKCEELTLSVDSSKKIESEVNSNFQQLRRKQDAVSRQLSEAKLEVTRLSLRQAELEKNKEERDAKLALINERLAVMEQYVVTTRSALEESKKEEEKRRLELQQAESAEAQLKGLIAGATQEIGLLTATAAQLGNQINITSQQVSDEQLKVEEGRNRIAQLTTKAAEVEEELRKRQEQVDELEWQAIALEKDFEEKRLQKEREEALRAAQKAEEDRINAEKNAMKLRVESVRAAREARSVDGSVLEYGLDYHLERMLSALDKGLPADPRFPERDNEWVEARGKEQQLLSQWLAWFTQKCGDFNEAKETIKECEEALSKCSRVLEAVKVPMAIQNARNARSAQGSILEYGLSHHLDRMNGALDKGMPGEPRFPERDTEWVADREKEHKLLVQWFDDFRTKFGEFAEAQETIKECEATLAKYQDKLEGVRIRLAIRGARNARSAQGSVLEYGLEHFLERFNGALDKGIPGDPRFPERDNEYVTEREKEQKLLVQWLEDFKSKFEIYKEAHETIKECEAALQKFEEKVVAGKGKLAIQNARNARSADGSVLEYGLQYHLDRMNGALDKGIPGDPRFPERDNEWVLDREKEQKLLVEWLEGFKSQFGENKDTLETIQECQTALEKFQEKVVAGKAKLAIQNARNARSADGSVLEYGLQYHLDRMNGALDKGIPGDPRFPERDNEWITEREKEQKLLVEWLEGFKSQFSESKYASETIQECEAALDKFQEKVVSGREKLVIQNARNARSADGSVLEYGLQYHLDRMNGALDKGIPGDPRFPERDNEWINDRVKEQKLLVEWLEDFKSKFADNKYAPETIEECNVALTKYQEKVEAVRIPLAIQNARNARTAQGSVLEYGLEYHLERFNGALDKGIPGDPRFPERDNEWVDARTKEQKLLVEWLEDFRSRFEEYKEAQPTIKECLEALDKFQDKVATGRVKLQVQNARNARSAEGSVLEYGLQYHLDRMNGALDKGIPGDPRFPERDTEWIEERVKEQKLLVEWLEDFKSKLGEHKEAQETIDQCQVALDKYQEKVAAVRVKLLVQNARNARAKEGSVLEYGLEYHLERFNGALDKGIPGDPRFPERDNEWVETRVKEQKLLVEWLEDFKSKLGAYTEAEETINECQAALDKYQEKVEAARAKLLIQNARNARTAQGSVLEYGLEHHLEKFNNALDKGIPGDPRFPERDNEWVDARVKEQKLLVEWLEDFKSKLGEYKEAQPTIDECQAALDKYQEKVEAVRVKLLVQNARNARTAQGSVLEYGLDHHLEKFNNALDKGVPGDPRFPERDNEWVDARVKEQKLLVEWLEDFKSKLGQYTESTETINECQQVLNKYQDKVESVRVNLLVQNARNARTAQGSVLEYGLQYHLEKFNGALDKGIPGDPRFPERDNEWVDARVKEQKLLVEWLEDFKSKLGEYKEAQPTIDECIVALDKYQEKVETVRVKLLIQNARNARTAQGSVLEYGLQHHLEKFNNALDKGIPGDPRFPERDNEWIEARVKEQKLLVEWLEDFKSKVGSYPESQETISECDVALTKYQEKVETVRIPLAIQNARNAKRAEGSVLEYGLKYHLEKLNNALDKGVPGDPRFPERDNEWVEERTKEQKLLVEWLEDFKSKFGEYRESFETIEECQKTLDKYQEKVESVRIKLLIQNARNARSAEGSVLEYGLQYHLEKFNGALDKGIPGDPRFPERDNEWIEARVKEQKLLVEWLEDFKSKLGAYDEALETIAECRDALSKYNEKVEAVRIPLAIQNARNARTKEGSCLEYGLKYHLEKMKGALDKGIPGDPRFPERDNEWVTERVKEQKLLVEWIEDFKGKFGSYDEALETIDECQAHLDLYYEKVETVRIPLAIQNARNAKSAEGSTLEYGLQYHLEKMNNALDKGIPNDPRFPERDNEWIEAREKEQKLLVEWLEDFKSKFEQYKESKETIKECEATLDKYTEKVEAVKIPLAIQNARNARTKEGSCLEYGLKHHLETMNSALDKGIPGDPRFPERDTEWVDARVKEQKLLVEWLEDFKSKFGHYVQATETLDECQVTLNKYQEKVESVRIPLAIQTARNAKRAEGSTLEYGLKYHLERMNNALDKGVPGDPRFPERDNEWIDERVKEQKLLVEWFEDFKCKFEQYKEAKETVDECEAVLAKYQEKVETVRIPLAIQNARNARSTDGSCLEYGLKYHLEKMNSALDKGIPGDPRFPERDNEWVDARVKEQKLLVEWLENFKSNFGMYKEALATIEECQETLDKYQEKVETVRIPLAIQNARNAKRAEGSILEYGLTHHLEKFNNELDKGIPADPRFPERDNEWIEAREKEQKLIVEWLEDFKSKLGQYKQSYPTIDEVGLALDKYQDKVEKVRIPLAVQNARNAKRDKGSVLEYGLSHHLEHMNNALDKGIPNDPRFPERDNEWMEARDKEQKLLVEWLEDFKSKLGHYSEAIPTISECTVALDKYREMVEKVKIPLEIKNARNARTILEFGLDHALESLNGALAKGIPNDPRFPERDNEWVAECEQKQKKLVEWLEDFKSKYGEYKEAWPTVDQVNDTLAKYQEMVDAVYKPLMIRNARNARRENGSVLEYGLDHHLKTMKDALEKGIPNDPRFPERDNEWMEARDKEQKLLVEWLEDFKSKFMEMKEAVDTIEECYNVLGLYHDKTSVVKIPLLIRNARNSRKADGSVLEYGLEHHLKGIHTALDKGLPNDPRFPERDNEWIEARTKDNTLLVEWLENFKSNFGHYEKEVESTLGECQAALDKYQEKVVPLKATMEVRNARNAKRDQGSVLEFGLDHHLTRMKPALEKGLPGDPRFPERDNEWLEERQKEQKLLIEWLEEFQSKFGHYKEAEETIVTCDDILNLYNEKVEKIRIPLLIQNAVNAKRAQGSVLEFGLTHHTTKMNEALDKGLPNDPRFPERDNEWVKQRTDEHKSLIEWLEDFKSKFGQYDEAQKVIEDVYTTLEKYKNVVEKVRIPLAIKNARNAKRAEGSVLEFGLDHHLKRMDESLEKGIPGDPRFPERDNKWVEERVNEKKLLVEWVASFESNFGQYPESGATLEECQKVLDKYQVKVETVRKKLEVQNAVNAKRADGSVLEFGLDHHLKRLRGKLEKGLPNNPRFPERDNEWVTECTKDKELLVEWLADFEAKFALYEESTDVILQCRDLIEEYQKVAGAAKLPLEIKNARNARTAQGSVLEFGLEHHLEKFNESLTKGPARDPRFPERDNQWLAAAVQSQKLLVEWLEDFKGKFEGQQHELIDKTMQECEDALYKYKEVVEPFKATLDIQNHLLLRKADGGILEYGFEYHLKKFQDALQKGLPSYASSTVTLDADLKWLEERSDEQKLLVEWLEDFRSKFHGSQHEKATETLAKCDAALEQYREVEDRIKVPLEIRKARAARPPSAAQPQQSGTSLPVLDYGLDHHLQVMNTALDKGLPNDPRFPERDNEWVEARTKEQQKLVEWLAEFEARYGLFDEAQETIKECQVALTKYKEKVLAVKIPLDIKNARNARRNEGSVLEYGLEHHLKRFLDALEKGAPADARFPERDNEWLKSRQEEQKLLVEWLEGFRSTFGDYEEARATIEECDLALFKYKDTIILSGFEPKLRIQNARNARKNDGSVLEYGLSAHLEKMKSALDAGLPNQDRFPERDVQWVEQREAEYKLLTEWLSEFQSQFGVDGYALDTVVECETMLTRCKDVLSEIKVPLSVKAARLARDGVLEYGLDFHLNKMNEALAKGPPLDPRFPERDRDWIQQRDKEKSALVEWHATFTQTFSDLLQSGNLLVKELADLCEAALAKYEEVVMKHKVPIEIKRACDARRADGSVLEFGLDHHLRIFNAGLDSGIPGNPRFPERDNEWLEARSTEYKLLVEWLEEFKGNYEKYKEAQEVIEKCEAALHKYQQMIEKVKIPMAIKNAVNARKKESLEYGLEHHLEHFQAKLDKGPPNDTRFPERDNEWFEKVEQDAKLLVEWLEDFRSNLGEYELALPVIDKCEKILTRAKSMLTTLKVPQQVKNARNARQADGSVLPYGLEHHLNKLNAELAKGLPNNPRFPERDNEWVKERSSEKQLLVEWLANFSSNFGQYAEAKETIDECEAVLDKFTKVIDTIRIPLEINNARVSGAVCGVSLGHSLDHHLTIMGGELEKGLPNDPRFPERDVEWLKKRAAEYKSLTEWFEQFRSVHFEHAAAKDTMDSCELLLMKYKQVVAPLQLTTEIRQAINGRKSENPNEILEYGLDYHLKQMTDLLDKGLPNDKRFPERDNEWIARLTTLNNLLVDWVSNFTCSFASSGDHQLVQEAIAKSESTIARYKAEVGKVKIPLDIKNARNARTAEGSALEYGLDHHLTSFMNALDKAPQKDERFPERMDEWIEARAKDKRLLVEWLADFTAKFAHYKEAQATIAECEKALEKHKSVVEPLMIPLEVDKACRARKADGSPLEYGLDYHLKKFSKGLEEGLPNDPRFPERDAEWVDARTQEYRLLVEWLEGFRARFGEYENTFASDPVQKSEALLNKYRESVAKIKLPLEVKKFRNARTLLEYGLDHHLRIMTSALDGGVPNDERFPEKKKKWATERTAEYNKLIEWLSQFTSQFGEQEKEVVEVIDICNECLTKYKNTVVGLKAEIDIEDACNARKADGSALEYGLKYHLTRMNTKLAEEVPAGAQGAFEWMQERETEKKLLVEWLSDFSVKFADSPKAKPIIDECEQALKAYATKVDPLKIPLDIAKAKEGRNRGVETALEYGLDYHLDKMTKCLEAGPPNDPRFPERDVVWMDNCQKDRTLLVEWLEEFKSRFASYEQALPTIKTCETVLAKYNTVVASKKLPLDVQKARNARRQDGSVLEYGLEFHLKKLRAEDLDVDSEKFKTDFKLLVEWLEEFRSHFVEYSEEKIVQSTVNEVEEVIAACKKTIAVTVIPLAVKKHVEARSNSTGAVQSNLEYGLDYHLKALDRQLDDSRSSIEIKKIDADYRQIVQWLCQFKSNFVDHLDTKEASEVVHRVEGVLQKYQKIIGGARTQQKLKEALEDRTRLPYGVKWSLEQYHKCLDSMPPSPTATPGTLLVVGSSCNMRGMTAKLIEWIEAFKTEFEFVPEAQETMKAVEAALAKCRTRFPGVYKTAFSSRHAETADEVDETDVGSPQEDGTTSAAKKKAGKTNFVITEEEYIPKHEEAQKVNDKEEPPFVEDVPLKPIVCDTVDPEADRKYPDDLDFAKAVMQEVEKKEKSFQQSTGKAMVLAIDWNSFVESSNFKALSSEEQKKVGMGLAYSLLSKVALSDDGISGICSDKVGKIVVLEKISRVCVALDPKNEIPAPGYKATIKDVTLDVVVNMKEYASSFSAITGTLKQTLEALLDLPLRRALDNVQLQVKAIMGAIQNVMERKGRICVRMDMSFMDHPNFQKEKKEVQVEIVKALINHAKRFLINGKGDSLAEICSAQAVVKREAFRKISLCTVTFDPTDSLKDYNVTMSGNDMLFQVNMKSWKTTDVITELVDKIDDLLGTITCKAVEMAKPKLRGYESMVERKIGANIISHVDWERWVSHPTFLKQPVKKQAELNETILNKILNELLNGDSGICEVYAAGDAKIQNIIKAKLKKISVYYDPTDSIDDGKRSVVTFANEVKQRKKPQDEWEARQKEQRKESKKMMAQMGYSMGKDKSKVTTPKHYRIWLDYAHCTLHVVGNMGFNGGTTAKTWWELDTKLIPLLKAAACRAETTKKIVESATNLSNNIVMKKLPITVNFEAFIDSWTFLGLDESTRNRVIKQVHDVHVVHLLRMFKKVCSHEFGLKAIQEQVNLCRLTITMPSTSSKPAINVSLKDGVWTVDIGYQLLINPGNQNWHAWQLRWALGVSIPIFKDLGVKLMAEYLNLTRKVCESDIALNFDWDFIDRKEFLAQDPQYIVRTIKNATRNFSKAVLHNGLNRVCSHPVGKECIQREIKTVTLKFFPYVSDETLSPSKHSRTDSKMEVQGNVLYVCCNPNTVENACKSRYKERIEFEYDLIVAIAKSNAMKTFEASLAQLREKSQYPEIEINVTHENFTPLPCFREDLSPPDQADIITSLYALSPKTFVDQITTTFTHQLVRDTFKAKVKCINITVDPTNKTDGFPSTNIAQFDAHRSEPSFVYNSEKKTLDVVINLDYVLQAPKLTNWRVRFLDQLDILVPVACAETSSEHDKIISELHSALVNDYPQGKKWPVVIDWPGFTKDPAFIGYHPEVQWTMVQCGNVKMLADTLLGNSGFGLPKGLCEFADTISKMNESIDDIKFWIDTRNTPSFVEMKGRTLCVSYHLQDLLRATFKGCHYPVEDLLQLRLTKQVAAIKRACIKIANDTKSLTNIIIPIEVNWSDFAGNLVQDEYVAVIDRIAMIPGTILIGGFNDFGDVGLNKMMSHSNGVRSHVNNLKQIFFKFDPLNKTGMHIGRSRHLNPSDFVLSQDGSTLQIAMNLCAKPSNLACIGRVAQFFFCSSEALNEEAQEVRRRAEIMRQDEEDRRRNEIQRAHDENKRIQQDNQREQQNYNKAMADWNKEINEKCNYSQCNRGYSKCGVCQGRGNNTNNGHTSKCTSCSGQGKNPCSHCNGSMKKHPNGLSQPSQPRMRDPVSIPSFGSMPNYESMI